MDDRDTQSALAVRRAVILGIPLALAVRRDVIRGIPLVLAGHRDDYAVIDEVRFGRIYM